MVVEQFGQEKTPRAVGNYRPIEPDKHYWKDCLKAGQFEPMIPLAEKYAGDGDKLLALYGLTTCISRQTLVEELGVEERLLWYAMKLLRKESRCSYAHRIA